MVSQRELRPSKPGGCAGRSLVAAPVEARWLSLSKPVAELVEAGALPS